MKHRVTEIATYTIQIQREVLQIQREVLQILREVLKSCGTLSFFTVEALEMSNQCTTGIPEWNKTYR